MHVRTLRGDRPALVFDPTIVRRIISGEDRRILDDHDRYECLPLAVVDGNETAFAMIGRRFYRRLNYSLWSYSQVLYCNAPSLLYRHLERVTLAVMRRQRTVGLALSKHSIPLPSGIQLPGQTMLRSDTLVPSELDKLYSELVLLPT